MRPSTIASRRAGAVLALAFATGLGAGCARTAEERQLADMRAEIDRIQEIRDREDRPVLTPEAADSQAASMPPPAPKAEPADQDAVTLGVAASDPTDDYADTEDTTPRPVIRVLGSARPSGRGWRGEDQVEQTQPDDGAGGSRPGQLNPAAATAYDAALSLVNSRQYDKALDALASFLVRWPDHPYADNAMYWRGECYFARGDYRRASEQFEGVVARFSAGNKAPDALLKLGISHQKLGDPQKAKECFDRLAQLYPQSDAVRRIPAGHHPCSHPEWACLRGPSMIRHALSRSRPRHGRGRDAARIASVLLMASVAVARAAWAQDGPAPTGNEGAGGSGAGDTPGGAALPPPPPPPVPMTAAQSLGPYGYGNPQSQNGTIGGGNATESSSHPVTGDQEDSFDLGAGAHGGPAASHGTENGPVFLGRPTFSGAEAPDTHLVRRGDTLWGLCDFYFQNPYQWPRLWSYNPQIKNPHWIYPGDEVRLKEGGGDAAGAGRPGAGKSPIDPSKMSLVDRRRQVPSDTVFLRDQGWIRDDADDVWGTLTGSSQDKMFLSDLDEVYLSLQPGHDVQLGQELSIFRPRKTEAAGQIVQILGTVRVDQYTPQDHLARARVVESLDVIERGASVGPIERKFAIVPPRRNEADLQAHVLASLHPNILFGQNQVVFIDKGDSAGLKAGNRLFVVRRGDAWRRSLVTPGAGYRVSADDERPMPPMESTPGARHEEEKYPDEVVAELRVLAVKKDSAVCLVTQSRLEIEVNDLAVARKGY